MTEKVINTIKEEIGAEIEAEEIDITYRVGQRRQDRGRGILVKFVSHKSKVKIMKKNRQAKNIRVSEDLAQGTRKMLNDIHAKKNPIGVEKAWTLDGKIKYKLINSERIFEIRRADDMEKLLNQAMEE